MKVRFNHIAVLLIISLSLISYLNTFKNEFVWDDHAYILENQDIREFDFNLYFTQDVDGLYRPLRTSYYSLVYSISSKNEFWYHLSSLALHTLISIILFFIIFQITGNGKISLISSLIFVVHPIHTGRVTNMTAGFDLLGILVMLVAFYFMVKFSKFEKKRFFVISIILFVLALLSSEEAIILPFLILAYELIFNKKLIQEKIKFGILNVHLLKIYSPYIFIFASYLIWRFLILGIGGRGEYLAGNFLFTILTTLKAYVYYLYLLFIPVNLTLYRDIAPVSSIFDLKVIFSLIFLAIILFFTFKSKNKILKFSTLWFFITLIPFSNIVPMQTFMAERYLYVPSIGFSLILGYFLASIFFIRDLKFRKNIGVLILIFLLSFYVLSTVNRNGDFKDDLSLWSRTVETNPGSSLAHDNLGFVLERSGKINDAIIEFEIAVELQHDNDKAWANLGVAYSKAGRQSSAVGALKKSLEIEENAPNYDKLGLVYLSLDEIRLAIETFHKSIELDGRYAKAYNDLGTAYGKLGEFDLAFENFDNAIQIDRDYADPYYNKGILLEFLGEDAIFEFETASKLEPENQKYVAKLAWLE
jgi:protein O-mannosyl-transferase